MGRKQEVKTIHAEGAFIRKEIPDGDIREVTAEMMAVMPRPTYEFLMRAKAREKLGLDTRMTEPIKKRLGQDLVMSIMSTGKFQSALVEEALQKPLELMKLAPKEVSVEVAGLVKHAILVPGTVKAEEWNAVHEARKELADGDWGVDLEDTPFKTIDGGTV